MRVCTGLPQTIGQTPMIRIESLSQRTGCDILGKAEFLNPGGSVKDRAALFIIEDLERRHHLRPGALIVEGTAGNTGIGLALVANAKGYRTMIVMPETQSQEKKDMLRQCGAELKLVPAVPYRDKNNYVRYSQVLAEEMNHQWPQGAFWANQFDNRINRQAHLDTTGPEIWQQCEGRIDAFTCAVGTGGTISGVGQALKNHDKEIAIVLADPMGSALYHHYAHGSLKAEGSSITEGIGQGRITENLKDAPIDDQLRVTDEEAMSMIFHLVKHDGLFLGGSSGINVCAAVKLAEKMGKGHRIVTILCDGGQRYQSRLFNPEFLRSKKLPLPDWL